MYLEEKIEEFESRIKALEERKQTSNDDVIVVKFKRERGVIESIPTPVEQPVEQPDPVIPIVKIHTGKQQVVKVVKQQQQQQDIEEPKEEAPLNEWVTLEDEENHEVYSFNDHTLSIFAEKGKRYAQVDEADPILLEAKDRKSFKQIQKLKKEMEKEYMK